MVILPYYYLRYGNVFYTDPATPWRRGDYLVSVLSLLATFIFGFWNYLTAPPLPPIPHPATFLRGIIKGWRRASSKKRVLNALTFLILGSGVGWLIYYAVFPSVEIRTTDFVLVEGNPLTPSNPVRTASPSSTASIVFQGQIPDRKYLGLSLKLVDAVSSGDCTALAALTLVPKIDGTVRESLEVREPGTRLRPATETRIDLGGSVKHITIDAKMDRLDRGCKVDLLVSKAVFYG